MKKNFLIFGFISVAFAVAVYFFYSSVLGFSSLSAFNAIKETLPEKNPIKIIFPLEDFSAALPEIDILKEKTLFISNPSSSIDSALFGKTDSFYLIYNSSLRKEIEHSNVFFWPNITSKEKNGYTILKKKIPKYRLIKNLKDISLYITKENKTTKAVKSGEKLIYGKNPWEYFGKRKVKIDGNETECLWLHPSSEYRLEMKLENLNISTFLLYLSATDTATVSEKDGMITEIAAYNSEKKMIYSDRASFDEKSRKLLRIITNNPEKIATLELIFYSRSKTRNHYCINGEAF